MAHVKVYLKRTKWAWQEHGANGEVGLERDGYNTAREALDAWKAQTDYNLPIFIEGDE